MLNSTQIEPSFDFEKRVDISVAVSRYQRAADRFQEVSKDFTSACGELRSQLPPNSRFVTQIGFRHLLVTSDRDGNFEVEQLEVV